MNPALKNLSAEELKARRAPLSASVVEALRHAAAEAEQLARQLALDPGVGIGLSAFAVIEAFRGAQSLMDWYQNRPPSLEEQARLRGDVIDPDDEAAQRELAAWENANAHLLG